MTPQQIFDHKQQWKPGHTVRVHSDLRSKCMQWCKTHVELHQWVMSKYTNVYEDTFGFEHPETLNKFVEQFSQWCKMSD